MDNKAAMYPHLREVYGTFLSEARKKRAAV